MQRDLSREAHLWYTITSPEYMDRAYQHLQEAFDLLKSCVSRHPFIADYRPVPYWGGVMEELLQRYPHARAMLQHGDYSGMIAFEGKLGTIPRGFGEGNMSWMGDKADVFMKKLDKAAGIAGDHWKALEMSQMYSSDGYRNGTKDWHVCIPEDMGIECDDIARYYEEPVYAVLGRPTEIPEYAPDAMVSCKTGDIVPWTGVWVPSTGMGTAALAFARQGIQIMQPAYEVARMDAENESVEEFRLVETTWHPVKPTGRMVPLPPPGEANTAIDDRLRCEANQPCPREGYWFTPAKAGSRRFFKQGEPTPEFKTDYGLTIWQWDENQAP